MRPRAFDPSSRPCPCGKRGWANRADAEMVVLNAKIKRWLRGKAKRRENRTYRCTVDPRHWHVTSQPLRTETRPRKKSA